MNNTTSNPFDLPSQIATFVIGIFGVLVNGVLVITMLLDPLKCFRRPSMYFVLSLAISDFFTGIASCMFAYKAHVTSKYYTTILTSALWASVENSFITILLMAIERLIVVRFPIKAKSIITGKRTLVAIALTWLVSLLLGAGVSFPPAYKDYVMFACLIGCFVIIVLMLLIYFKMLVLLRTASKTFRSQQFVRHSSIDAGKRAKYNKYQRNLNVVVFCLALVLIITVLPHLIVGFIYLGYKLFYPDRPFPTSLMYAPYVSFPIELLNFVLNSVIYAYRLPQFRAAFCYYLRRKSTRNCSNSVRRFARHGTSSKGNLSSDETVI